MEGGAPAARSAPSMWCPVGGDAVQTSCQQPASRLADGPGAEDGGELTVADPSRARAGSIGSATSALDRQREVWVHVYDMGPVTGRLNQFVLRGANLGAFHVGVEVLGEEWSFQGFHDAWDDDTLCGVLRNPPRNHPDYLYRESVCLGMTPLDEDGVDAVVDKMMEEWPANTYHIVSRNCVTFAEELTKALSVPEEFPAWVRGAIDAAKAPGIFAIADYGWEWFKWYCKRQCEQDAAEQEAEAQRILLEMGQPPPDVGAAAQKA